MAFLMARFDFRNDLGRDQDPVVLTQEIELAPPFGQRGLAPSSGSLTSLPGRSLIEIASAFPILADAEEDHPHRGFRDQPLPAEHGTRGVPRDGIRGSPA